ncbi:hypothetical protein [Streptomyces sp. NPDC059783]|uniref:hypothetical protein n=1 Tax=Streptomyces sp. NPDC059783 TaxID=3346944 RepID=UPI0036605C9F
MSADQIFVPRTEREYWVAIADALNAAEAAGMSVGIDLDATLTDHRMWSVVWSRDDERWEVAGYDEDVDTDAPREPAVDPLVVSRFDVAIEPAPEEEQLLTVECIAEDGRPVALLLDAETRAKVARWLDPQADQLRSDVTGACLARWEEEQGNARLRLALKSAQRGRRMVRERVGEVIAARDAQIIAWLEKKAAEEGTANKSARVRATAIYRMADKLSRGAVRPPLSKGADPVTELTPYEQLFLTFALELAADQMASRSNEFDAADEAALVSLRRLTGGAA